MGFMIIGVYGHFIKAESIRLPGLAPPKNPNLRVLDIDSFKDWVFATLYTGIFYFAKYYFLSTWLENTNSMPKNEYRLKMTIRQRNMGLWALFWVIIGTTLWMWLIEPLTPYYGYYVTHDLTLF